jgi:hypothetical protein
MWWSQGDREGSPLQWSGWRQGEVGRRVQQGDREGSPLQWSGGAVASGWAREKIVCRFCAIRAPLDIRPT